MNESIRLLIVAANASSTFSGESGLALHYFIAARRRAIETHLLVHARNRSELEAVFPSESRIHYVDDTGLHRFMSRIGSRLPQRFQSFTTGMVLRLSTQWTQRRLMRGLFRTYALNVVHQVFPVSPCDPSLFYGLGVPVLIGPMNGGMNYPPAFIHRDPRWVRSAVTLGRSLARLANWLIPGKRKAAVLLVANHRTRDVLPGNLEGRDVRFLCENGVDLGLWAPRAQARPRSERATRFAYMGRLVDWKAVDLLLEAFTRVCSRVEEIELVVVGEGPERPSLERFCSDRQMLADSKPASGKVYFAGWLTQAECAVQLAECDALVLPSLLECGGAVVLEAMAASRAVIATDWGGPADYLDPSCGVLVAPTSEEDFISGLVEAMSTLARSPELCEAMGRKGREKVERLYDWDRKMDQMVEIYKEVLARHAADS